MSSFIDKSSYLSTYSEKNSSTQQPKDRAMRCCDKKTLDKTQEIKRKAIEEEYLKNNKEWSPQDGNFFVFLGDERRAAALSAQVYRPSSTQTKEQKK